ncbi:MAG: hypothetical protein HYW24_04300 [Candidatus Aenigmarchaeota archaeon]|nr:hypothetical protein [Candidatus Aenigmarchaeota archaeon]
MSERTLEYHLTELVPDDFEFIPTLNIYVAKTKAKDSDDKVITGINWYEAKLIIQRTGSCYFLLTSSQWEISRKYLLENRPELEKDFTSGESELVDSLLVLPNGERPTLLIEYAKVERFGDEYGLIYGNAIEVPEMPLKSGHIQAWDENLGLPVKVGITPNEGFETAYFRVNIEHSYDHGLRAVVKSHRCLNGHKRLYTLTDSSPSDPNQHLSFRLGRTANSNDSARSQKNELSPTVLRELDEILSRADF